MSAWPMRDAKGNVYELGTVEDLPAGTRYPSAELRATLDVGDVASILVHVNGSDYITPWLEIIEVTPTGYVGEVGGVPEWLPPRTPVTFTADNVIWAREA